MFPSIGILLPIPETFNRKELGSNQFFNRLNLLRRHRPAQIMSNAYSISVMLSSFLVVLPLQSVILQGFRWGTVDHVANTNTTS